MKAFLLAGGLGTRLLPLTKETPKCLLPIRGTPILQIWFQLCRQYGIDEVLVNVHSHRDVMRQFIEEREPGLPVRIFEEDTLLGSAGTVLANREWVSAEKSFWILYADILTTANLGQMLRFHNTLGQIATIGVCEVQDPSRCGIVKADDGGIVRQFIEKPATPIGNLAFSGLMLGTPALLESIPDKYPLDFGFDVLPRVAGRIAAYRISEFLSDIGTLESYQIAQRTWPGISRT